MGSSSVSTAIDTAETSSDENAVLDLSRVASAAPSLAPSPIQEKANLAEERNSRQSDERDRLDYGEESELDLFEDSQLVLDSSAGVQENDVEDREDEGSEDSDPDAWLLEGGQRRKRKASNSEASQKKKEKPQVSDRKGTGKKVELINCQH